ncbi:MAG: polyamine aminopropyltransferase [Planctomycetota bacterium]|nr:MAG: polyamine aminopropyltransferase [Planctomycetota bacterium]
MNDEQDDDWFTERMQGVAGVTFKVTRRLHQEQSAFQRIEVFESAHHGRVLVLDDCIMLTELDEFIYHEMLTHVAAQALPRPRRALVVGGGDGGLAGELLRYPDLEVTVAEIDERVVRVSQEFFPAVARSFDDPRVTLAVGDGARLLAGATPASLDLVLVDSTDPVGPATTLVTEDFYQAAARALRADGVFVAQTQSPFYHAEEIRQIYARLGRAFARTWMFWAVCPSYPGFFWTFCFASQSLDPLAATPPLDLHRRWGLRYYTAEVHRAAFALPPFAQDCLPEGHPQRR